MPLISVILPSYNHEKFIAKTIESVLNQDFTDLELIIIDDASKDRSREIINEFQKRDDRIKVKFHKKNIGHAKTMNEGIQKATGKFIAFLDSDDIWKYDKLKKQLNILRKDENLVIWSEGVIIDIKNRHMDQKFTEMHKNFDNGNIFLELIKGNFILKSSMIFKKENINKIKFDDKIKYFDDYKFNVDLAYNSNFYFIKESLTKYRVHGKNTIFNSNTKDLLKDSILLNKYFLQRYGRKIPNKLKFHKFCEVCVFTIGYIIYNPLDKNLIRIIFALMGFNAYLIRDFYSNILLKIILLK